VSDERDEVKEYLEARYISSIESCWQIFEFGMHAEHPTVYRLPVHLPNEQLVYFNDDDSIDEVLERGTNAKTAMTEYFVANANHPHAKNYTYQEFPQHFTWNKSTKKWSPRKKDFAIGRMYFAAPSSGERFYLRTLLTVVKGAKSFEELRTVNGEVHPTFQSACLAHGLLEDDNEWKQCLQEAGDMQSGSQLRALFAVLLLNCNPTSPGNLWHQFREKICDDLQHAIPQIYPHIPNPTLDEAFDYGLYLLQKILSRFGKSLSNFVGMPAIVGDWGVIATNPLLQQQLSYDQEELAGFVAQHLQMFNLEQRAVYDAVMASVDGSLGKRIFLHSAGGGGKTFVCNTVAAAVRSRGRVALCVASSGIAALLLEGGRTSHSRFHIPIAVNESSFCDIKKNTHLHELLMQTDVIIWDEVPMQHRHCIEAVDRTLRDILSTNAPFGGITLLFGGDFRQTLPVVPRGSRGQIISASLRKSDIWHGIEIHDLWRNEHLDRTPESEEFAKWLLDVGAGKGIDDSGNIELPAHLKCGNTVDDLINSVYPDIHIGNKPDAYFLERTILACKNDDVFDVNKIMLDKFPGQEIRMMSADSVVMEAGADGDFNPYPIEFLNSIRTSGLPLAELILKEGCPIMLLRNLDPDNGLCNGTRMVLVKAQSRVLECRILGGQHAGKTAFIPRISMEPSNEELPIKLRRRQFPVHLCFAMTVNKSQGQSVSHVGLNLQTPVFSHGQLYVALSRCTSGNRIKILFPDHQVGTQTSNIVYPEILL
jgi:hypothetical protein